MVVVIARFVAVLRSVIGFIAGASRMPFANFMTANSAGAVAWALFYGLGAYFLGKGVERFARPFAMALAAIGTIVLASIILYWRRKEQELAAAAERDNPRAAAGGTVGPVVRGDRFRYSRSLDAKQTTHDSAKRPTSVLGLQQELLLAPFTRQLHTFDHKVSQLPHSTHIERYTAPFAHCRLRRRPNLAAQLRLPTLFPAPSN